MIGQKPRLGDRAFFFYTVSPENAQELVEKNGGQDVVFVELQPGETFLCHNWTVHMSGQNTGSGSETTKKTDDNVGICFITTGVWCFFGNARRALSVNFVDGRCRALDPPPVLSGAPGYEPGHRFFELFPSPFEEQRAKAEAEKSAAATEQCM